MAPLKHRPTHDWIIGTKVYSPEVNEPTQLISGVVRFVDKPPHHYATVVAVGPGRAHPETGFRPHLPCAIGDTIMVRAVAGDQETIEGEVYYWFQPDEVLAVVE